MDDFAIQEESETFESSSSQSIISDLKIEKEN